VRKSILAAKSSKPKTWLITALLASLAVAYIVFLFLPGQQSIFHLQAQVQERRQHILQAESLVGPIAQAREQLAATREVSLDWQADAPTQSEMVTHLAILTQQAEAAGVKIERLDPLPTMALHLVAQQNVTLQFNGGFPAAFDLLRRLESLPGTIWVRNLRLSTDASSESLRGELTLTIFVDRSENTD
jgi:Tfp pilus assembly protein PilO